jgi:hypothetical protein
LTLTRFSASRVLALTLALDRLPLTRAALAAGAIDERRAAVIADELIGLDDEHAAAVEASIIGAAPGQTTGELRPAVRRAVIAADPAAARRRKEQALKGARVEASSEPSGTATLAGRDLPPAGVLAADKHLSALDRGHWRHAGCCSLGGVPGGRGCRCLYSVGLVSSGIRHWCCFTVASAAWIPWRPAKGATGRAKTCNLVPGRTMK